MKKKYLYNGEYYTEAEMTDFAKQSGVSFDSYIAALGKDVKVLDAPYEYKGNFYTQDEISAAAKKKGINDDAYLSQNGIKKKEEAYTGGAMSSAASKIGGQVGNFVGQSEKDNALSLIQSINAGITKGIEKGKQQFPNEIRATPEEEAALRDAQRRTGQADGLFTQQGAEQFNLLATDPLRAILDPEREKLQTAYNNRRLQGVRQTSDNTIARNNIDPNKTVQKKDGKLIPDVSSNPEYQVKNQEQALENVSGLVKNKFFKNGKEALEYAENQVKSGIDPTGNETIEHAITKAGEYKQKEESALNGKSIIQNAIEIQLQNDPLFKKQYETIINGTASDAEIADVARRFNIPLDKLKTQGSLPQEVVGELVHRFISDPDIKQIAEDNPEFKKDFDNFTGDKIYEVFPEYADVYIKNTLSRARELDGKNNWFANPIFDKSKYMDNLAEEVFKDRPILLKRVKDKFHNNWEHKIETTGIVDDLATGARGAMSGMWRSLKDVSGFGESYSDRIRNTLKEQYGHVETPHQNEFRKVVGEASNFMGMVLAMGATGSGLGNIGKGLGVMNPSVASKAVTLATFFDDELNHAASIYPENPTKAYLRASLSTAFFLVAGDAIPASKITGFKQNITQTLKSLETKALDKQAKMKLRDKILSVATETLQGTAKGTAEMTVMINGFKLLIDRALGLDESSINNEYSDANLLATAKSMLFGLPVPSMIHGFKGINRTRAAIYEMASNPEKYKSAILKRFGSDDHRIADIDFIADFKKYLDSMRVAENEKAKMVFNALHAKRLREQKSPDAFMKRNHEEEIRAIEQEQQDIMDGKDSDAGLTDSQKAIKTAYENGEINEMMEAQIKEALKDPAKADQFIKEIAEQATGAVAPELGNAKDGAIKFFGETLTDFAIGKSGKKGGGESVVFEYENEGEVPQKLKPLMVKDENGRITITMPKDEADALQKRIAEGLEPDMELMDGTLIKKADIKIKDVQDGRVKYKGEEGTIYQDGQTLVFKVDGKEKEYELGNVNDISDKPISELGIEQVGQKEVSVVSVADNGNVVVREQEYVNNYSDPFSAINRDSEGNVISVTLDTKDGKKRTFRGSVADDIAYQITLKEIEKNNETKSNFEQFINTDESKQTINDTRLQETAEKSSDKTTEPISPIPTEQAEALGEQVKAKMGDQVSEGTNKEALEYAIEKIAEAPIEARKQLGDELFEKVLEATPTEKLQEGLDFLIDKNSDDPNVKELDKIIFEREKKGSTPEQKSEWQKEQEAIDNDSSLSEAEKEKKKIESTAKQKSDPDLANIDPVIIAARNGDKQAQKKLEEYGLDWEQTTTYRFVGQPEVDVLLSDKKVESKRFSDAGIDVTTSPKVTSAANAEYRVTFKESFDVNNGLGKVKVKSKEEGDHNLEKGRGYTLNDVAKIERLDENGNVVEVIYDSESLLSKEQTLQVEKVGSGVGGDVERNPIIDSITDLDGSINKHFLKEAVIKAPVLLSVNEKSIGESIGYLRKIANEVNDTELTDTVQYLEDAAKMVFAIKDLEGEKRNEFLSNSENFWGTKKPALERLKRLEDWSNVLKANTEKNKAERLLRDQYQQTLAEIKKRFVDDGQKPIRPKQIAAPTQYTEAATPAKKESGGVSGSALKDVESTAKALEAAVKDKVKTPNDLPNTMGTHLLNLQDGSWLIRDGDKSKEWVDLVDNTIKQIENIFDVIPYSAKTKEIFGQIKDKVANNNYDIANEVSQLTDATQKEFYIKGREGWGVKEISEAYHKAKADGSNPELVAAVEDLLGKPKAVTPNVEDWSRDVESTAKALEKGNGNAEYSKEGALNVAKNYHKAKKDGTNPELVKAVEDLLSDKSNPKVTEIESKKADIERRRPTSYIENSKNKKSSLETFRNEAKREWDGVSVITGDRMQNLYVGIQLFVEAYPEYKELLDKFIKNDKGYIGITNNNLSFVLNTLKKEGVTTESELGAKINAKYDAELAELEKSQPTPQTGKGEREVKQQIETFGVPKQDVEPVHNVITQVFDGLKKAGLTAAKTVGEWVGIGKGEAKPYTLKINGEEKTVKPVNSEVVNGFYSPLEKTINETKFDKLPAKQWIDKFAKGEEAKWTGLSDWLAQQQGSVSKADIQKYLKDNRIQVVEVVKGYEVPDKIKEQIKDAVYSSEWVDLGNGIRAKGDVGGFSIVEINGNKKRISTIEAENLIHEELNTDSNKPKYNQYQLEGEKENYKEVLVTLPEKPYFKNDVSYIKVNGEWYGAASAKEKLGISDIRNLSTGDKVNGYFIDGTKQINRETNDNFKSTHFDEPNILVHLRMNTRTDADGNKVLFLEEVQSDWGQKGKKEGFKQEIKSLPNGYSVEEIKPTHPNIKELPKNYILENYGRQEWVIKDGRKIIGSGWDEESAKENALRNISTSTFYVLDENGDRVGYRNDTNEDAVKNFIKSYNEDINRGKTASAPFVTDTNAWTKLGLKVALKEAVAQGAERIAWTTGSQQNERYDLSKSVDYVKNSGKTPNGDTYIDISLPSGLLNLHVNEKGIVTKQLGSMGILDAEGKRLDDIIGKDIAERILSSETNTKLEGEGLKVGGKGMKGFYGEPSEGVPIRTGKSDSLIKVKSFKTQEGDFEIYDTEKGGARGRGDMFTVFKSKDGWIIRNAFVPEQLQKKGIATDFYLKMNEESIKKTGKPLRSTQERILINGERVHELSKDGISLWDSFVKKGYAIKNGEKNYSFKKQFTGKLGIVGAVAKALVKELTGQQGEIVETKVKLADKLASGYDVTIKDETGRVTTHNFDTKSQGLAWLSKQKNIEVISEKAEGIETATQHSIEITPELRAAVEKGQPLFKEAEAQYRIESGKNIIEAIKDFDGSPRATVALTHEIMHPTVVSIIDGAKEGNETGARHANTIVEEYNKANPDKKITLEQMIEGNDAFINGRTTPEYRAVQEFIAEAWEKYHHEGAKGFSKAFQEVLDAITEVFRQVYKSLTGTTLTPELRKMFDELLGKENVSEVVKAPEISSKAKNKFSNLREKIKQKQSLKIVSDEAENRHANSKLTEADNPVQEPNVKALESEGENAKNAAQAENVIIKIDSIISAATDVGLRKVSDISTDEKRFQGRDKLNAEKVQEIAENWKDADQDPIHVWTDPKDGKTYVLSGHHRLAAAKQAGREKVKVIDRSKDFTEEQAIRFAKEEANANRTMETAIERANTLRQKRERGDTKDDINKFLDREGKNKNFVNNLSRLNPKGKTIEALRATEKSDDKVTQKEVEKIADWIGEARDRNKNLTDAHENELFDFLMDREGSKRITTKQDFLSKVNSLAGAMDFNANEPLNIARYKHKTEGEKLYDKEVETQKGKISDLQQRINEINDRIKNPNNPQYLNPDSKDYEEIKKNADNKLSELNTELQAESKALLDLYQQKGKFARQGTEQSSLFSTEKNETELPEDYYNDLRDIIKDLKDEHKGITLDEIKEIAKNELGEYYSEPDIEAAYKMTEPQPPKSAPEPPKSAPSRPDKSVLTNIVNAENTPPEVKKKLTAHGLKYDPESHDEALQIARAVIDSLGIDAAVTEARARNFGGAVNTFIQTEALNALYKKEAQAKTAQEKYEAAEKFAEVSIALDEWARGDAGRGISALATFYQKSPLGMVLKENKSRKEEFNQWAKGKEESWDEFLERLNKTPEFSDYVSEKVQTELREERKKERSKFFKKVDDTLDKWINDLESGNVAFSSVVPPKLIAEALKGVKAAFKVGESATKIIGDAIDYISDKIGDNWDKDTFRAKIEKALNLRAEKTSVDRYADSLKKQIEELQKQIDAGSRNKNQSNKRQLTPEEQSLLDEKKRLQKELNDIDPKTTFAQRIQKQIDDIQRQIDAGKRDEKERKNKKEYSEEEKELQEKLKAKKAELEALSPLKNTESYKLAELDKFREKLKGLSEAEKDEVVSKAYKKLLDNGALDHADLREIIAKATGRGNLTEKQAARLQELNETINAAEIAKQKHLKERTEQTLKEYHKAIDMAAKAKRDLANEFDKKTDYLKVISSSIQGNTLGLLNVAVMNPLYNITTHLALRLPIGTVQSLFGLALGKAEMNTVFGKPMQAEFFGKGGRGFREAFKGLLTGMNKADYESKEIFSSQIRPNRSLRALLGKDNREAKMKLQEKLFHTFSVFPGATAETNFRLLNFGDKPMRYSASAATAAAFAKKYGIKFNTMDWKTFMEFPREIVKEMELAKGKSLKEAEQEAEYVVRSIEKEGERSTMQQDNFFSDMLEKVFSGGKHEGAKSLAKTLTISPFVKIPSNVLWLGYNLVHPQIALAQAAAHTIRSYGYRGKGEIAESKLQMREARYWMSVTMMGAALQAVMIPLIKAGIITAANDEDDSKKKRIADLTYQPQGMFNMTKFWAYLSGKNVNEVQGGFEIPLKYFGLPGALGNSLARDYKQLTPEQKENRRLLTDNLLELFDADDFKDIENGIFSSSSSLLQGLKGGDMTYYAGNMVNLFTNLIQPAAVSEFSRAAIPYRISGKFDSLGDKIKNDLSNRSALFRKLTGKYPKGKRNIWGEIIKKDDSYANRYFGFNNVTKDNFAQFIYEDAQKWDDEDFLPPTVSNSLGGKKLTAEQLDELEENIGLARKEFIRAYTNDIALIEELGKNYSDILGRDAKKAALQYLYQKGRKLGVDMFVSKHPEFENVVSEEEKQVEELLKNFKEINLISEDEINEKIKH